MRSRQRQLSLRFEPDTDVAAVAEAIIRMSAVRLVILRSIIPDVRQTLLGWAVDWLAQRPASGA